MQFCINYINPIHLKRHPNKLAINYLCAVFNGDVDDDDDDDDYVRGAEKSSKQALSKT